MNELKIVNEYGEVTNMSDLRPETLKKLSNEQLQEIDDDIRYIKNGDKALQAELKSRLDAGEIFPRISYQERTKRMIPSDDEKVKTAFLNKYGLDAVEVKSSTQLKKIFGEAIQEDMDKVTIIEKTKAIKRS